MNEVSTTNDGLASLIQRREEYNLSPEELMFVIEVSSDFDYERAYAHCFEMKDDPTAGRKLANRPDIASAIMSEIQFHGERLFITKQVLISRLWGEATNMRSKPSDRLKAIELLGRMLGTLDYKEGVVPPQVNVYIKEGHANFQVLSEDAKKLLGSKRGEENGGVGDSDSEP